MRKLSVTEVLALPLPLPPAQLATAAAQIVNASDRTRMHRLRMPER
jgi:hypothetical protein